MLGASGDPAKMPARAELEADEAERFQVGLSPEPRSRRSRRSRPQANLRSHFAP